MSDAPLHHDMVEAARAASEPRAHLTSPAADVCTVCGRTMKEILGRKLFVCDGEPLVNHRPKVPPW